MSKYILMLFASALLSGCATYFPDELHRDSVGKPEKYRVGLTDGCTTASQDSVVKEAEAYRINSDYRAGWDKGYRVCKEDRERFMSTNAEFNRVFENRRLRSSRPSYKAE